ncbi:MAG: barstar family protein [Flammeovirgaceae bacterium]
MVVIKVNGNKIQSWDAFHNFFARTFGFPNFYGKNMNAWIDCMSDLDHPEFGMTTKVSLSKGESLVLSIVNAEDLKNRNRDIFDALIECSAHINRNRIERGDKPFIYLAF